jgi:hypothetical protein
MVPVKVEKQPGRQRKHSSLLFWIHVGEAPWNGCWQQEREWKTHWPRLAKERIEIN